MIHVTIRERDASAKATEPITSGSVGLPVLFRFSADWEGLGRIAVFNGSGQTVDVAIRENQCVVPHEVLCHSGGRLKVGVYGTGENGSRVTPTVWANAGMILPGTEPSGVEPGPPTENLVQQLMEAAQSAEEIARSVREEADAGAFIGPPGPKGDKGDPGPAGDVAVFVASFGSTTAEEIEEALKDGKAVFLNYNDIIYSLADVIGTGSGVLSYHFALPIVSFGSTFVSYEITLTGSTWTGPTQRKIARTDSPSFTGTPKAPTAAAGTNTTQVATTAFVQAALSGAGGGVFWAEYNATTEAEISTAVLAGKTVLCKIIDEVFYLTGKAAFGPSGSAWLFASANQTSLRVTFVSGSYWNSISTLAIPTAAADIGAITAPSFPETGAFLVWNGSAWEAQTLAAWQGGNY